MYEREIKMDNDLISRTEVLKYLEEIKCDNSIPKNYGTILDIMRFMRSLPTVDNDCEVDSKWISVSERFPNKKEQIKNEGDFLCFTSYGHIQVFSYSDNLYLLDKYDFNYMKADKNKKGFYDYDSEFGYSRKEILAWQPLPPRYEPKED